ncbi:hypothetical protein [Bdellovibrio sp. HCB337]|uniref:hypothetical protein n=1 Tax=Bdellovibrio sp. HCB337 TaxID=3394358 RepID=UPI0039A50295
MKKFGMTLGLFLFSFCVGYGIILHTSDWGPVTRDPAAIRQVYDFSSLTGTELTEAMKKRILAGATVVREHHSLGVELGHFAMAKITGEKTLACQEFATVVLRFEAEGIATSGERPVMEVEGACEFSSDMTKINPIFIPVDKIMAEKPSDGEIQYREGRPVTVRFKNVTEEWPTRWLLTTVRLSHQAEQKELLIDAEEVSHLLGRPMMMSFK